MIKSHSIVYSYSAPIGWVVFVWFFLNVLACRAALAEISVEVPDGEAEENIELFLSLSEESCTSSEWKVRALFAQSDQEIDKAMRALGYYHAQVKKSLSFKPECWQATFTVDPGPRVMVRTISIRFAGDAGRDSDMLKLRDKLSISGWPLRHDEYEKIKSRIESKALEKGYLKGSFSEAKLLIDKQSNQANIELIYDSGPRYFFGDITVQQDILNPDFVEKFIAINRGDYYESGPLVETYNALAKSNYFDQVDIRPDIESGNLHVPVSIHLTPKPKYLYGFGAGFDTDIGPLLNASYADRRINRRGHFVTANIDLSPVKSTLDAEYSVPLKDPANDFFSIGAGANYNDTESYKSKTAKLSARLKHNLDNGWKQTLFLDYLYEEFKIGVDTNNTLLLVPGGSWVRSVADDALRPTKGYRLEFEIDGSYEIPPISEVSFLQGSASGVWIHPVVGNGRFIARTELGATWVDKFDKLPATFRYFAGGMNSIRGYAYKELGPKDKFGNVVGGQFLGVVSAEYEKSILDNWGIAAFVDSGNAFNLDDIVVKTGVGMGVRWYSPIGPVRIDFGYPLNDSDSSFQIHFAAGSRL